MQNFLLGMMAVLGGTQETLGRVSDYPMFWGFATGFLTSTIMHAFLIMDSPRHIPTALLEDKARGFEKLYPKKDGGSFTKSYSDYSRMADRARTTVLIAILIMTIFILVVVLTK